MDKNNLGTAINHVRRVEHRLLNETIFILPFLITKKRVSVMARQLSGQYTIQNNNQSEGAIDKKDPSGDIVRVYNAGSNVMHIGNGGSDSVDNTNGYELPSGDTVAIRIDDPLNGGRSSVFVYGTSGDTLKWITIA
jgi:hypothetical protein